MNSIIQAGKKHVTAIVDIHNSHVLGQGNQNGFFLKNTDDPAIGSLITDRSNLSIVCLDDESVAGYLIATPDAPELDKLEWMSPDIKARAQQSIRDTHHWHISQVAVSMDFRGSGIGAMLYDWVTTRYPTHIFSAYVATRPLNRVSLRFHRKQGFIEAATFAVPEFMGIKHYESRILIKDCS